MRVLFCLRFWLGFWVAGAWLLAVANARSGGVEDGAPLLRWWEPEDYRAHQQIWQAAQTPDGVMWFGNAHSVLRFDGERWLRLEVPTSFVRVVAAGPDGRVWVGGTDELGVIEPDADGLPAYRSLLSALPEEHREPGVVWSVVARSDGVFYATESRVLRWDGTEFRVWVMENFRRQLLQAVGEELTLHRQGVGLFRYAPETEEFVRVADEPRWRESPVCRIVARPDGSWLMVLADGLLWRWNGSELERWPTAIDGWLAEHPVRYLVAMPGGGVALGGRDGVVWLDAAGGLAGKADDTTGMGNDTVFSLMVDREGALWVGTDHGVGRLAVGNGITRFDERQGLPRSLATALVRHGGQLHAAYAEGVFRLRPAAADVVEVARWERIERGGGQPWGLLSRAEGLLVGTLDGVWWWPEAGEARRLMEVPQGVGLLVPSVTNPDRVWVGNFLGLRSLRWTEGGWVDEGVVAPLETEVRTLVELDDGTVWVGTPTRGFARLGPGPAGARAVEWFAEEAGLRPDHGWSHVYRDGAGAPLFVTYSGTYRFDGDTGRLRLAEEVRLPGRSDRTQLWPLTVAADGTVWAQADTDDRPLPTQVGAIMMGAPEPGRWRALPREVVAAGGYGGLRAMTWEAESRRLWLVGSASIVAVDVDAVRVAEPLDPVIARAELPGGKVIGGAVARWAHDFARSPLRVELASPWYGTGPGMAYRWRMSGYDEAWSPWSEEARAVFTNLAGGDYRFEVQARDQDGREGAVVRRDLRVAPPWWLGMGAKAAAAGLLAGVSWLVMRWRVGLVERRARRLEQLVEQRTTELVEARDEAEAANRAKSEFVAGISHELRHPLQSILGHAERLRDNPALPPTERERGMVIEASGRRLLRLIDDVLDVARLDAGRLSVRPAACGLAGWVDRLGAAQEPAARTRGLDWRVTRRGIGPTTEVMIDAERVGQIVDNLVSNAFKFTARGEVELRVTLDDGGLVIEVRDEGPGIAEADRERIFAAFEQGAAGQESGRGVGLGLAISRGLATLMGGSLSVMSEMGRGSCFTLWLPVGPLRAAVSDGASTTTGEEHELIAALREAAGCGDVARLRELAGALAGLPAWAPMAGELEKLLARFQLAGVRRLLDGLG